MVWAVNYTESAKKQLRKLDKQMALRILDFMDARIVTQDNPRSVGKALTGPMLGVLSPNPRKFRGAIFLRFSVKTFRKTAENRKD